MNKNMTLVVAAVALIVLLGGGLYFANQQTESPATETSDSMMEDEDAMMEGDDSMTEDDSMMEDEDSMMEGEAVEVSLEGSNYEYDQDTFTVEAGQEVTVTLTSTEGMHDFVLEDMDVSTDIVQAGDSDSVTFTAPEEPGEYTYYCSVGNHRALGMVGTMIVE